MIATGDTHIELKEPVNVPAPNKVSNVNKDMAEDREDQPASLEEATRSDTYVLRQNFQSTEGPLWPLISHQGSRHTALTRGPRKQADKEQPGAVTPRTTQTRCGAGPHTSTP